MTYLIQVTADDIREGVREDCCKCPVALAIYRAGIVLVGVRNDEIEVVVGETYLNLPLPEPARDFIANFDESRPDYRREPEPFNFEIELP